LQAAVERAAEGSTLQGDAILDSLGFAIQQDRNSVEDMRLMQCVQAVLMLMVLQGHFWGAEGVPGDRWEDAHKRVNFHSRDLAMPAFSLLAAIPDALSGHSTREWPARKDVWLFTLAWAMVWPLPWLTAGLLELLASPAQLMSPVIGQSLLTPLTTPKWFLFMLVISRTVVGLSQRLVASQLRQALIAVGLCAGIFLVGRQLPDMKAMVTVVHTFKKLELGVGPMALVCIPVYVLTYYAARLDVVQKSYRYVSSFLRGRAVGGLPTLVGWQRFCIGWISLALFLAYLFHIPVPDNEATRSSVEMIASVTSNLHAFVILPVGLAALQGLSRSEPGRRPGTGFLGLDVLGRTVFGAFVFNAYFLRNFAQCAELCVPKAYPGMCAHGGGVTLTEPCAAYVYTVFSGFWLAGVEVVPAPPVAVALWRHACGLGPDNQASNLFIDFGSAVLLWAYPVLFLCTFGPLFYGLLVQANIAAEAVVRKVTLSMAASRPPVAGLGRPD
jgi:hypothetical protein